MIRQVLNGLNLAVQDVVFIVREKAGQIFGRLSHFLVELFFYCRWSL